MLVVEDGSIVAGANSYNTLVELRAYALARGVVLPSEDTDADVLGIKANDFIESLRTCLKGCEVDAAQALAFPRYPVYQHGNLVASNAIPSLIKQAQAALTVHVFNEVDLFPVSTDNVKREKVGPLETEFFSSSASPVLRDVRTMLKQFLKSSCGQGGFSVIRV